VSLLHWEDFVVGSVACYGPRTITREEILAFAAEFDPQPMHADEEAARATMLGGLAASGWHTCALAMRMMADICSQREARNHPAPITSKTAPIFGSQFVPTASSSDAENLLVC